jgi:hypothetical protein
VVWVLGLGDLGFGLGGFGFWAWGIWVLGFGDLGFGLCASSLIIVMEQSISLTKLRIIQPGKKRDHYAGSDC